MEELSSPLIATTDPSASRKLFELERAIGQVPLEERRVVLLVGLEDRSDPRYPGRHCSFAVFAVATRCAGSWT
jgi:hypothetical protein